MVTSTINAVINFNYFCLNYNHNFIEKVWEGNQALITHLKGKFLVQYEKRGTGAMVFFFADLDFNNQILLAEYINKHYVAFKKLHE